MCRKDKSEGKDNHKYKGRLVALKKKGNEKMSPKELMYIQDALGHEEQMIIFTVFYKEKKYGRQNYNGQSALCNEGSL